MKWELIFKLKIEVLFFKNNIRIFFLNWYFTLFLPWNFRQYNTSGQHITDRRICSKIDLILLPLQRIAVGGFTLSYNLT